jgi:hypothetical protein
MSDKALPAGWVVQVTVDAAPAQPNPDAVPWRGPGVKDAPSFQYFNVAIADSAKAMEATKKLMAKGDVSAVHWDMSAVRGLSAAEIAALDLKSGEVKPA